MRAAGSVWFLTVGMAPDRPTFARLPPMRQRVDDERRRGGPSTLNEGQIAERGARLARRDDREYREYLREEQRRQPGCPAREVVLVQRGPATSALLAAAVTVRTGRRRGRTERTPRTTRITRIAVRPWWTTRRATTPSLRPRSRSPAVR